MHYPAHEKMWTWFDHEACLVHGLGRADGDTTSDRVGSFGHATLVGAAPRAPCAYADDAAGRGSGVTRRLVSAPRRRWPGIGQALVAGSTAPCRARSARHGRSPRAAGQELFRLYRRTSHQRLATDRTSPSVRSGVSPTGTGGSGWSEPRTRFRSSGHGGHDCWGDDRPRASV
jgi:hypothetical protein